MTSLEIHIDSSIDSVWDHIANIESHTSWMEDAETIVPEGQDVNCVGSIYHCATKVGPLKTKDTMKVTRYQAPTIMEMEHIGSVTGKGTFQLVDNQDGTTLFKWEENLKFPWYMGGSIGKAVGMILLHNIWRKNLATLKLEIENKSRK